MSWSFLSKVFILTFSLFERGVGSKEEEGRPGSHRRGQKEEEEEKEEGRQKGKGGKFGGR